MIPIIGSKFFIADDDANLVRATKLYGATHIIEAVKGTTPRLNLLRSDQSVIWGDGKSYHFRLTKK